MSNPKTAEHEWIYGGTSPETICIKCGFRRDAPEVATNSQAFAPCKGRPQTTDPYAKRYFRFSVREDILRTMNKSAYRATMSWLRNAERLIEEKMKEYRP